MVSISRKDLYSKLWSIGITKTAIELNIPYNKLKNACLSNDIPLPTASYWSSLHMGKEKPTQLFLPNPNQNPIITIEVVKAKKGTPQKITLKNDNSESTINTEFISSNSDIPSQHGYFIYFTKDEQILFAQIYNSLKVNKTISSKPHKEILKYQQKKKDSISYYDREAKLKINSSSGTVIPETLPFIDCLFKSLEKVGAKISITNKETQVIYKSYTFILNFKLPSNKVKLSPDDKDYSRYNTYKYVATGKMNVEVGYYLEWYKWSQNEKLITQTKKETFDDLLKKVFLYIFSLPQKIDEETEKHKVAEEKKRREEEQRAILKDQHDREYQRTEGLIKKSIEFFYSQLVKNYVESELHKNSDEYNWGMNKSNWIKDCDASPDSILSTKDKENLINFKFPKGF
ncbi:hypothetical protein [Neobacillus citreus]|uniref:Uncharacterized protein n=1 Tax=Neobacillus citreus TaxID=2833578 RepID=A0A942T811_9BACI|nr:hypothetical protein [Neobacillus citreus]MCH6265113.1 hypothetical protein [Neobacillus citreus]